MIFSSIVVLLSSFLIHDVSATCDPVTTQPGFDLESYVQAPWYIHQQAVTEYSPIEWNYCTRAIYSIKDKPTLFGYTIDVMNYAEDAEGNEYGGPLCAAVDDSGEGKLKVAPCFIPKFLSGPYWVISYDESEGYALVSGGQPTIETENGCTTGEGINNSGLWIFLRTQERNEELIQKVRGIATEQGFDLTVLNDVDQTDCNYGDEVAASSAV